MERRLALIIDNDRFGISVLQNLFETFGFDSLIGSTFEAADTLLRSQRPGIIVYNRDLEIEWGLSILERLRATPSLEDVPVIMLSQTATRFGPRFEEGRDQPACFQKPVAIDRFVALFRELTAETH